MTEIPERKIVFKFSRSSGPGGQNVNKVSTKVTAFFDVAGYDGFSDEQKALVLHRLAGRVNDQGAIKVVSQRHRTQTANRKAAVERLNDLLTEALKPRRVRKKTAVPYAAGQKRLEKKRKRGILKRQRAGKDFLDSAD